MKPTALVILVVVFTTLYCCKKSNEEIATPATSTNDTVAHIKKGIAESNYKLILQTDKSSHPDQTQPGFVMKDTFIYKVIDINVRLRVDSETRKAYYVKQGLTSRNDTLVIADSTYAYFYGKPYYGRSYFTGMDLVTQQLYLQGDSILLYQSYMIGNIGAWSSYKGYKIP